MEEAMCVIEEPTLQPAMRSLAGKAHPCLLVDREGVAPLIVSPVLEDESCVCACMCVSMPRTCPSYPRASCNLPDTRKAPSDFPLLGPLDSPG